MKKLYLSLLLVSAAAFAQSGNLCTDPIVISSVPFSVSDDTANYGDNYDPPTSTPVACGAGTSGNYYLGGNDVVYSYTPTVDGNISIQLPGVIGWTGLFVFTSCSDIGSAPYACNCSSAAGNRTINNMPVTAGVTYYIVLSTWPTPQTFAYTMNITAGALGVSEAAAPKYLKLYPNPAISVLNLNTDVAIKSTTVISINGQRLQTKLTTGNQINIENLQSGFYILEVISEDGAKVYENFIKS